MITKESIASLTGKQFVYYTANNGNPRMYILRGIERMTNEFAVCKVVDKSHDSKTGNKQVFKTLHFGRIDRLGMGRFQPTPIVVPDQPSPDPRFLA